MSDPNLLKLKLEQVRNALADYIASEGCDCCCDTGAHGRAAARLGRLLGVKKYKDGSGYDFRKYKTEEQNEN